tara:strand:- start:205 stop:753 length:549 start_codon:yes stop_codon:yes gene_type:complete
MFSWVINFVKTQRFNLIVFMVLFITATYFNLLNSLNKQDHLINQKLSNIHTLLDYQLIFMKKMLQEPNHLSMFQQNTIQELVQIIKIKSDSSDPLGYASKWLTVFNNYLLNHSKESIQDYLSMKTSYESLLSLLLQYNLEVNRYNLITEKKLLRFVSSYIITTEYRLVANPILTISAFEVVY